MSFETLNSACLLVAGQTLGRVWFDLTLKLHELYQNFGKILVIFRK